MIGIDPYSVLLFNRVQTRVNIINDDATNRNISACPYAKNAFSVNQLMYIPESVKFVPRANTLNEESESVSRMGRYFRT